MTDQPCADPLVPPRAAGPSRTLGAATGPSRTLGAATVRPDRDADELDLTHEATLQMLARALPPSLVHFLR